MNLSFDEAELYFTRTNRAKCYNLQLDADSMALSARTSRSSWSNENQRAHNPQEALWKPKIRIKKLYEEPKFLMSVQRRKTKSLLQVSESQIPLCSGTLYRNFRAHRNSFKKQPTKQKTVYAKAKLSNLPSSFNTSSSPKKRSLINYFNMHLMIEKRKSFKSEQNQRKKGSNEPYYSYLSSDRFNKSRLSRLSYNQIQRQHILLEDQKTSKVMYKSVKKQESIQARQLIL